MKIKELMTKDVEYLDSKSSLKRAAQLMSDADVGSIPVVDEGRVVGVLTDRDIVVRTLAAGINPMEAKVGEVMTPEVIHCGAEDDVEQAAELMAAHQIRRVVVTDDDGGLAGIVALADLATRAVEDAGDVLEEVSQPAEATPPEVPGAQPEEDGAALAALVKDELAAVETYESALARFDGAAAVELRRIKGEHADSLRRLREILFDLDLDPPARPGLWGAFAEAAEGAASRIDAAAALRVLKEGEEHGIRQYRKAIDDDRIAPGVKNLICETLLPRIWSHVSALDRLLQGEPCA